MDYIKCNSCYHREMSSPPMRYGYSSRGVGFKDVSEAADALLRQGERPTVEKIRIRIGTGSPNTINPLLDQWWKRLSGRLDNGPPAFHRLPEAVAHIAEALWMAALDQARGRAVLEQAVERRAVTQDRERFEIRSHVLSLREAELESRLKERESTISDMDRRLTILASSLKREQSGRNELLRKLTALQEAPPPARPTARKPKASTRKSTPHHEPRKKSVRRVRKGKRRFK